MFADLIRLGDWVGMNPFADICQLAAGRRIRTWPGEAPGMDQGQVDHDEMDEQATLA
ncbi:hypothetical protein D9M68_862400 [compost metagenome]